MPITELPEMTYVEPKKQIKIGQQPTLVLDLRSIADYRSTAEVNNISAMRINLFSKIYIEPDELIEDVVWEPMNFTADQAAIVAQTIAERSPLNEPPLGLQ